jgi:septum site-determining protein MinC
VATHSESRAPAREPLKIRGGSFTCLVLNVVEMREPDFFHRLLDKIAQAPMFFERAPVVLDLEGMTGSLNIAEVVRRLRQHQLVPIGVQNGTDEQEKAAANAGLSLFPMWRSAPGRTEKEPPAKEPAAKGPAPKEPASAPVERQAADAPQTRVVTKPVRSGGQIYAKQGDLIALASVSPGAELLADGHIHIYAPLRGRAHAGVKGDTTARIFCSCLAAELVSIAGRYKVRDAINERFIGRAVQIFLDGEQLVIEPLA